MKSAPLRLTLLGVGAMNSARYAPAGLLVERGNDRIMLDGGPSAAPNVKLCAWLVTDERGELIREIRKLAEAHGLQARVESFSADELVIEPRPVVHTSHAAYGYLIKTRAQKIVWAPEFFKFPAWAKSADIMFAEAASWSHPIRFRGGAGGHAPVLEVAQQAQEGRVKRLVFAHIGRPTIRAIDAGMRTPFGEFGKDGAVYLLGRDF
jgi:hypothetical protein